jgi:hypothetical protein
LSFLPRSTVVNPTDHERLRALERLLRHVRRQLEAQGRKLDGIDQHYGGLLRDARQRLRRLERMLKDE